MNMKKITIALIALIFCVSIASAQSLYNNEYYQKSIEFKKMADTSYSEGKYEEAYEYALEADKYAKLSDDYIKNMKEMYRANTRLRAAMRRIEYAERIKLNEFDAARYLEAKERYNSAKNLLDLKSYADSLEQSEKVIQLLEDIQPQAGQANLVQLLPKFYTVRLLTGVRDCFWKISEYDFVYGDRNKWETLYNKNKNVLVDPENPHIIHPGQVFEIPAIKGEQREGMYDSEIDYPSFKDID